MPRLTRLREKLLLLKRHPIDRVLILRFNETLAKLSAEQFVKKILVDCDFDGLIYLVDSFKPACHTGNRSCFHNKLG